MIIWLRLCYFKPNEWALKPFDSIKLNESFRLNAENLYQIDATQSVRNLASTQGWDFEGPGEDFLAADTMTIGDILDQYGL